MLKNTLFINPLEEKIFVSTFGEVRQNYFLEIPFLEFAEKFPKILSNLVKENKIEEIWCITGPAPFTKIRVVTLAINSIKFFNKNIILKSCHFFDLIQENGIIPIIEANKNEVLIRNSDGDFFKNIENLEFGKYVGYLNQKIENIDFKKFENNEEKIQKFFEKLSNQDLISPIYIKNPNITC